MSLTEGVAWFENLTGIHAAIGGRHANLGTHNAVAAVGGDAYLELLAVDPDQEQGPCWMGYEICPGRPKVIAWAARPAAALSDPDGQLDTMVQDATAAGMEAVGEVKEFARKTTDGQELRWRLAYNHWKQPLPGDGLIPFLIAWGEGANPPMRTTIGGLRLQTLRLAHPEPSVVEKSLGALRITGLVVNP